MNLTVRDSVLRDVVLFRQEVEKALDLPGEHLEPERAAKMIRDLIKANRTKDHEIGRLKNEAARRTEAVDESFRYFGRMMADYERLKLIVEGNSEMENQLLKERDAAIEELALAKALIVETQKEEQLTRRYMNMMRTKYLRFKDIMRPLLLTLDWVKDKVDVECLEAEDYDDENNPVTMALSLVPDGVLRQFGLEHLMKQAPLVDEDEENDEIEFEDDDQ